MQRQKIGDRLARMLFVGQRVDDVKTRRRRGKLLEQLLRKGPDHDGIDPALEIAGDVGDRFAASQGDVGLERHEVAAELAHADLERRPRAQRRLVEEHRDVAAIERVGGRRVAAERAVRFEARRQLETALEIGRVEVEDGQKVFVGQGCWCHVR